MYTKWNEQLALLSNEQKGVLFTAIMNSQSGLDLPEMDGIVTMAFSFITSQIAQDAAKYEETCAKRKAAGEKGGAPLGNSNASKVKDKQEETKTSKNKQKQGKQAKQGDNDNDNDNDNDFKRPLKDYCAEPKAAAPAIITLPTNKTGEEYPVTDHDVKELASLYPCVNVDQELRSMRGWLLGNPTKRKTLGGMPRFIHNWLAKEQNKGSSPSSKPPAKPNGFNTFAKSDYDFDDLEKKLLSNSG